MSLVQVLIRKHMRPGIPGEPAREIVYDYRVDATYVPGDPGDRETPPTDEGFDISEIYHSDGKTPVLLTDDQVDEIEQIMLDNVHATWEDEKAWRERERYTD